MDSYGKNKIIFNDKNSPKIEIQLVYEIHLHPLFEGKKVLVIFIPAFLTNMLKTIRYKCYHSRYKNKPRRHKG